MVTINSNYAASFAANAAKQTQSELNSAVEKLSTGKRINFSRDDAAGNAIAMRLESEIASLKTASRSASDGQSLIDTADGALKETYAMLIRMRELAVQAQNGTLTTADKSALGVEFDALKRRLTEYPAVLRVDKRYWMVRFQRVQNLTMLAQPPITHLIKDLMQQG